MAALGHGKDKDEALDDYFRVSGAHLLPFLDSQDTKAVDSGHGSLVSRSSNTTVCACEPSVRQEWDKEEERLMQWAPPGPLEGQGKEYCDTANIDGNACFRTGFYPERLLRLRTYLLADES